MNPVVQSKLNNIIYYLIHLLFIISYSDTFSQVKPDSIQSGQNFSSVDNLFSGDGVFDITLSGNLRELFNDRGEKPQYHSLLLSIMNNSVSTDSISIMAKTRGHFRKLKENCTYAPLLLSFSNSSLNVSNPFFGQNKLKLVTPCQGDKYVIREFLVYKLYNLITNFSFKARLVRVIYEDPENMKKTNPLYGIILEEEEKLAQRNYSVPVDRELVRPENTNTDHFLKMAVFQYMIGNTDWSVQYIQNIKLFMPDTSRIPVAVPYDFDHAGIVNAPYARPAEQLNLTSIRQRRYRGYCINNMGEFNKVFKLFNQSKSGFYNTYLDCALLEEKYKQSTIKFLDEFYQIINDPVKSKTEFMYPCLKGGTGNIVIRGLK